MTRLYFRLSYGILGFGSEYLRFAIGQQRYKPRLLGHMATATTREPDDIVTYPACQSIADTAI